MSSTIFIPPPGLRFRLVGYLSHCAVFSRTTQEPYVGHCNVSQGTFPDQWFTLLPGTGDYAGRYAIKGEMTEKVLYVRPDIPTAIWPSSYFVNKTFPEVGHFDDKEKHQIVWFQIEPGSGQYANYFRLIIPSFDVGFLSFIVPSYSLAMLSRSSPDATLGNSDSKTFNPDQLFHFMWEDMNIDKVEFDLNNGKIIASTPIVLTEQLVTNDSNTEQEMSSSINKGITNSSTFEYSGGFTVSVGVEFEVNLPKVTGDKLTVEASTTHTWTNGETTEFNTQYTGNFPVKAGPHQSVVAKTVVNQGTLDVPYTIYLSSKSSGLKVQTSGTWRGVSSWDLRHSIIEVQSTS